MEEDENKKKQGENEEVELRVGYEKNNAYQ
jgi:hypothetical protein